MVFSLMKIYQLKSSSLHLYRSFLGISPRDTEIWQYAKDKKTGYCYERYRLFRSTNA
ncbi:hypothetical protein C789_2557 [Microcystis aeruginosa FACHB-905 = DIANCHI905]|nr:hypothetical protein C789_2548 [Microcystis aeruginosa FACHB-905 = DIANCHI905]ELS47661.1 hypothetical protein C789_2557 [Microcystis aeruginosa FACHB-905 = DIANCHI905]